MLEPHRAILSTQRIVLASSSPRRKEILSNARLPSFEIVPPECEENLDRAAYANKPWDYAADTAELKAWCPDGDSQIFRSHVFGPSGLKDYGSATLRSKI